MRGLSGAVVTNNGNGRTVTKSGGLPGRTREQGDWIIRHGGDSRIFPRVHELLDDGYVMEKLEFIDYWEIDSLEMVEMLRNFVWVQPPVVPPTDNTCDLLLKKMQATVDKWLGNLISRTTQKRILIDAMNAANGALSMSHCLTHGDPTAENVMYRPDFGKVLIDPIRATEVVPDSPAVDIGKMLQSACGWEHAKYSTGFAAFTRSDLKKAVNDDELFAAGEAWATVHVIRAVPYVFRSMPDSISSVLSVLDRAIERR